MRTMDPVRADESPGFRISPVGTPEVNSDDPADETHANPPPFQPLVIGLHFLGVKLDPSTLNESSTKCYRYTTLSIGLFLLLLNGFFTIFSAVIEHNGFVEIYKKDNNVSSSPNSSSIIGDNPKIPPVFSWNLIVDYVNHGVLVVGVHVSLFLFSSKKEWKLLWNNVQQIYQHHNEFKVLRKSIRRITIAGLVDICLETLGFICCSLMLIEFYEGQKLLDVLFRSFANFFLVFAMSGFWLFAVIGWTVALGFRSLGQELLNSSLLTTNSNREETIEKEELIEFMAKWKSLHVLLCDTVDGINDCFGPILLLWVAHIFIGFISIPYYILDGIHFNNASFSSSWLMLIINFCLLVQHIFHFLIITGISSRIWHEAVANGKLLQQVNLDDSYHLQDEVLGTRVFEIVNMLTTEVVLSLPRITAMEYGDLDLSLIPTLIGTTLTYLIILCQFQSSEE